MQNNSIPRQALGYYAYQCLNRSGIAMNTHTLSTASVSQQSRVVPVAVRIGRRLGALVAAFIAWRRVRAAENEAIRAGRELAGLSAHVLRDIGEHDAAMPRGCTDGHHRHSAIDLEMRG